MSQSPPTDYFRFCPGEEQIKLSNAVCRGRRRSSYPKCHGCRFNDDEKAVQAAVVAAKTRSSSDVESVFTAIEVRGIYPSPLSEDVAWRIGHASAQFLRGKLRGSERADPNSRAVVVGRDMRTHGAVLQAALIDGIRASGTDVINVGLIDTPQLYFAVNHHGACGGIQTTASHRAAHYNGFIVCGSKGISINVETGLAGIRDIAARVPRHQTGTTAKLSDGELAQQYRDFVLKFLRGSSGLARPISVVVDASNGMAGRWIPQVFGGIPNLKITPLNFDHTGRFTHIPDPTHPSALTGLKRAVKQHKADFGICFDGDADRVAFVDERGQVVSCDLVGALIARNILEREPGAAIVHDLRCSRIVAEEMERAGGRAIRERVGRPFITKAMYEQGAVFGMELSGHYYFRDNLYTDSGLIAFAQVINVLVSTGRKLGELVKAIQRYRTSGEVGFKCPDREQTFKKLRSAFADARIDPLDGLTFEYPDWWFNVRASRTTPALRLNIEARTKKLVDEKLAELTPMLGLRE